jgi:hypothetical protein
MTTKNFDRELAQSTELRDDDLEQVVGGLVVISIIAVYVGLLLPAVNAVRGG